MEAYGEHWIGNANHNTPQHTHSSLLLSPWDSSSPSLLLFSTSKKILLGGVEVTVKQSEGGRTQVTAGEQYRTGCYRLSLPPHTALAYLPPFAHSCAWSLCVCVQGVRAISVLNALTLMLSTYISVVCTPTSKHSSPTSLISKKMLLGGVEVTVKQSEGGRIQVTAGEQYRTGCYRLSLPPHTALAYLPLFVNSCAWSLCACVQGVRLISVLNALTLMLSTYISVVCTPTSKHLSPSLLFPSPSLLLSSPSLPSSVCIPWFLVGTPSSVCIPWFLVGTLCVRAGVRVISVLNAFTLMLSTYISAVCTPTSKYSLSLLFCWRLHYTDTSQISTQSIS